MSERVLAAVLAAVCSVALAVLAFATLAVGPDYGPAPTTTSTSTSTGH